MPARAARPPQLLRVLGLPPEWLALLTEDAEQAAIHVLGMGEQLHEQACIAYSSLQQQRPLGPIPSPVVSPWGLLRRERVRRQRLSAGVAPNLTVQALAERIKGTRWERVVAIRPTGEQ